MSELLINRLKNSIGLEGIVYLVNGFRFECKIISCDGEFLEFYDTKKSRVKVIKISEISEVDLNGY
jgi:sRNA-binding regulator protein Hfq